MREHSQTHPGGNPPELTVDDDRNRERLRALDLHDETGQIMTAVLINLEHLDRLTPDGQVKATVRDTRDLVELLFHSIRNYLRGAVRPEGGGRPAYPQILPALDRLTAEFARRTGIRVRLETLCDPERLPGEHKAVIYRVVQESLTHVFRHSAASSVVVRCGRNGKGVRLEIEDDGLRPDARPRGAREAGVPAGGGEGSGVRGMRERIRLIGGEFRAGLVDGRGMSIVVELPYNIS